MMNNHAIVTDGLWRKSLSAIRSLGKAGYNVHVLGSSFFTTGFWSRYTATQTRVQDASKDTKEFLRVLMERVRELPQKPVIFLMEDASVIALSAQRKQYLKHAHVLLPPEKGLEIAESKALTMKFAQEHNIPSPKTLFPKTAQELTRMLNSLDPATHIVKPYTGSGSAGVIYNPQSSIKFWQQHWKIYGELIIQERVPSQGLSHGVSLLFDKKGECIASFAHERLQQYPNSGGPSTDRVAIHDPELVAISITLMKKLHWRGIAMVEWKLDPKTMKPKLMEINPRFWGSLELAVRAGVNFPLLYAQAALGKKVVPAHTYRVGTRCRWVIPGDILRYLTQEPAKRESLFVFLRTIPRYAEEWDLADIPGFLSTIICTVVLACNPRYWKYVRRG